MPVSRRLFVGGSVAFSFLAGGCTSGQTGVTAMYGLIGKFIAADGQRDALIGHLLDGLKDMPGCLSYIVARDPAEANIIWVTEVWTDAASHQASLALPSVQAAIRKARPLIAGMEQVAETAPAGGHGLALPA
jgi:quinol monooxygenase YgiN